MVSKEGKPVSLEEGQEIELDAFAWIKIIEWELDCRVLGVYHFPVRDDGTWEAYAVIEKNHRFYLLQIYGVGGRFRKLKVLREVSGETIAKAVHDILETE